MSAAFFCSENKKQRPFLSMCEKTEIGIGYLFVQRNNERF